MASHRSFKPLQGMLQSKPADPASSSGATFQQTSKTTDWSKSPPPPLFWRIVVSPVFFIYFLAKKSLGTLTSGLNQLRCLVSDIKNNVMAGIVIFFTTSFVPCFLVGTLIMPGLLQALSYVIPHTYVRWFLGVMDPKTHQANHQAIKLELDRVKKQLLRLSLQKRANAAVPIVNRVLRVDNEVLQRQVTDLEEHGPLTVSSIIIRIITCPLQFVSDIPKFAEKAEISLVYWYQTVVVPLIAKIQAAPFHIFIPALLSSKILPLFVPYALWELFIGYFGSEAQILMGDGGEGDLEKANERYAQLSVQLNDLVELSKQNEKLVEENTRLRQEIKELKSK